jgi:hypothetical protein
MRIYTGKRINESERGVALIQSLLIMALMLAMMMGITLTAISELGVTNTYSSQTQALQAAEAGLNHAASLVKNYNGDNFSTLLGLRTNLSANYLPESNSNNPFINAANFAPGSTMITYENATRGYRVRDGVTGAVVPDTFYRVSVIDDEPTTSAAAGPKVPNFTPAGGYKESTGADPNNANIDQNNKIVIYSTGSYLNASVTLEGWIAFLPYPAMISNQPIAISGNAQLLGSYGGVHSNDSIAISGSPYIAQTATATGAVTTSGGGWQIDGFHGGLQPRIDLPTFVTKAPLPSGGPQTSPRIQDFIIQKADTLLIDPSYADGASLASGSDVSGNALQNAATARLNQLAQRLNISYTSLAEALQLGNGVGLTRVQQTNEAAVSVNLMTRAAAKIPTVSTTGWTYSNGGGGSWGVPPAGGAAIDNHTFYVIGQDRYSTTSANGGNVDISGNLGGGTRDVSILATGSITLTGNTRFTANIRELATPELPPFVKVDLMLLAVQDIKIRGDVDAALTFNGIVFAGEQFDLSGNGTFNGQVMSFGNTHTNGSPVSSNIETGSFTLSLNDGNSFGNVKLISWRQIKR